MFSVAHFWICKQALYELEDENIIFERNDYILDGAMAPDYDERALGGHFAVYRPKSNKFTNWKEKRPANAFDSFVNHYIKAIETKDLHELGRAIHYLTDMLTIPHATGISDARLRHMIFIRPHRRYEKYTLKNIGKYYEKKEYDVNFDDDFFNIMLNAYQTTKKYKWALIFWSKKKYDRANYEMIPMMVYYVKGFLRRYYNSVK